jgi:demethylmenaquinone methyltransferase/2-methoxy-6-polyprenyl-1,4-benzoquinol methylase
MTAINKDILDEQIAYYSARAPEYDEWFLRLGRYDRGDDHRRAWFAEVTKLETALTEANPGGQVLELACGTGQWTRQLAARADAVTAIDASSEVLRFNRERVGLANVEYILADLFAWKPSRTYDFVFFGFWLTHVPPELFSPFWSLVQSSLRPGGMAFFIDDNTHNREVQLPEGEDVVMERRLNDGRRFRVVKVFYEPAVLQRQLAVLGWDGFVRSTGEFFIYGCVTQR